MAAAAAATPAPLLSRPLGQSGVPRFTFRICGRGRGIDAPGTGPSRAPHQASAGAPPSPPPPQPQPGRAAQAASADREGGRGDGAKVHEGSPRARGPSQKFAKKARRFLAPDCVSHTLGASVSVQARSLAAAVFCLIQGSPAGGRTPRVRIPTTPLEAAESGGRSEPQGNGQHAPAADAANVGASGEQRTPKAVRVRAEADSPARGSPTAASAARGKRGGGVRARRPSRDSNGEGGQTAAPAASPLGGPKARSHPKHTHAHAHKPFYISAISRRNRNRRRKNPRLCMITSRC